MQSKYARQEKGRWHVALCFASICEEDSFGAEKEKAALSGHSLVGPYLGGAFLFPLVASSSIVPAQAKEINATCRADSHGY